MARFNENQLELTGDSIEIRRWTTLTDRPWHPMSEYVELYWLPVIGPSTLALVRYGNRVLEDFEAVRVGTAEVAWAIGLGPIPMSKHGPFGRAIRRACSFHLTRVVGAQALEFTHGLPSISERSLERFSDEDRTNHRALLAVAKAALFVVQSDRSMWRGSELDKAVAALAEAVS